MAITSKYGPIDYNPHYARNEFQFARLLGAGTEVMVANGAGSLGSVVVGVAGTLAKFYDVASGGTTDDTTEIVVVDTSVTGYRAELNIAFSKGLTVITTGASSDLTVAFRGRPTTSTRTFGAA
jgi:hypothetical protein